MRGGITSALGAQPGRTRYSRRDNPTLRGLTVSGSITSQTINANGAITGGSNASWDMLSGIVKSGVSLYLSPSWGLAFSSTAGKITFGSSISSPTAGISHISGSLLAVGSGSIGDYSGSLKLTNLTSVGTVTPGSFTTATTPVGTVGGVIYNTDQSNLNVYNGTSWDTIINSSAITRVSTITQAAYNALSPPSASTLYVITDAVTVGPSIAQIVNKTADYTITSSDYCVNVTSNTRTITLPSAIGLAGYIFVIKNSGAGTVTVTGSETIDGNTTAVLAAGSKASITVQSTGTNYIII